MATGAAPGTGKVFRGRTVEADAPFVGGDFWEVGKRIQGEITKVKPSTMGGHKFSYVMELESPVEMDGEEWDRVTIGNLTGFALALQAAGVDRLFPKDVVMIECESIKKPKKEGFSPRPNFAITVNRL